MSNKIELKSVDELSGMNFFIPSYQRGYRWEQQQVEDLLNDIYEFQNRDRGNEEIYCIQPLVVKYKSENVFEKIKTVATSIEEIKSMLKGSWDVIDGQQRLTTIHILLSYLEPFAMDKYSIEYETRKKDEHADNFIKKEIGSNEFLRKINTEDFRTRKDFGEIVGSNIDFYHMDLTFSTIRKWFDNTYKGDKNDFLNILKNKVQFIWYETDEANPIRVFTRLNIGKIALTDSELIKALFLNSSNFGTSTDIEEIRLQQVEIASEWDRIEYMLQNDEFWLFIHAVEWSRPTRIDFLFDLMREKNEFKMDVSGDNHDEHQTFRYFYNYFQKAKSEGLINSLWIRDTWMSAKKYFQIFEEWYNDLEMYHYVGYLVCQGVKVADLVDWYCGDNVQFKVQFNDIIKEKIKEKIKKCSDLTKQYEIDKPDTNGKYPSKTTCPPLLILYNIQTVVSQNKGYADSKYKMGVFYKFPFHLLKKENWDVEHIDSSTTNELTDDASEKEFLLNSYVGVDAKLQSEICDFLEKKFSRDDRNTEFENIVSKMSKSEEKRLSTEFKNKICNFALLDSSTNRGYGNAIFPAKRRILKGKDNGKNIGLPQLKDGKFKPIPDEGAKSSFVPICTKQVFMKYYTAVITSETEYNMDDALAYVQNINDVLSSAGFIENQINAIKEMFGQNEKGVSNE